MTTFGINMIASFIDPFFCGLERKPKILKPTSFRASAVGIRFVKWLISWEFRAKIDYIFSLPDGSYFYKMDEVMQLLKLCPDESINVCMCIFDKRKLCVDEDFKCLNDTDPVAQLP